MKKLIKGLHKFQREVFSLQKNFFQNLAKGQNPDILFITCSDSRINPNLVTSADPGDLFILRNAGNIIPEYALGIGEAATIEFAVEKLNVKDIIVCGHSHCGALEAAIHFDELSHLPALQSWIAHNILPTVEFVKQNYQDLDGEALISIMQQEHVLRQVENLKIHPLVMQRMKNKQLNVHAWIYRFETGDIFSFNVQEGQFELIKHL